MRPENELAKEGRKEGRMDGRKEGEHFYEQGKADATRDIVATSKNINSDPKPLDAGETLPNGWKVRAISGVDSSKLKIKKKK